MANIFNDKRIYDNQDTTNSERERERENGIDNLCTKYHQSWVDWLYCDEIYNDDKRHIHVLQVLIILVFICVLPLFLRPIHYDECDV